MAELVYIRDTKEKNILILGISEGEDKNRYTVNRRLYAELGMPSVGSDLDSGAMEEIYAFDLEYRAKKKALSLLSIADNNKNSLMIKLRRAGFPREVCETVTAEMIALGYINEEDQLKRQILSEAKKYSGPKRIMAKLQAKGYSGRDISRVMSELECSGEIDFKELQRELKEKYLTDECDYEEVKKLFYKHGF